MGDRVYKNKIFKIEEVKKTLGLVEILRTNKLIVTYNQLMKNESIPQYLFLFNETGPEVPGLILFCRHFGVCLLKISSEEAAEIQKMVKHARLIAIPKEIAITKEFHAKIKNTIRDDVQIDILRLKQMKI